VRRLGEFIDSVIIAPAQLENSCASCLWQKTLFVRC
jgi:hypothetical protein